MIEVQVRVNAIGNRCRVTRPDYNCIIGSASLFGRQDLHSSDSDNVDCMFAHSRENAALPHSQNNSTMHDRAESTDARVPHKRKASVWVSQASAATRCSVLVWLVCDSCSVLKQLRQ
jgi:hypothetical protein